MTRSEITDAWKRFTALPYPTASTGLADIRGVDAISTDTFLAGCISYFVEMGSLDPERVNIAQSACRDLKTILPHLPKDGREYFELLLQLGLAVIDRSRH